MIRLKYGNTNTFFIPGLQGGLLIDTDYAGTLSAFYKAIRQNGIQVRDVAYVLATHYHPDHMGLIGALMQQGVRLLLVDVQKNYVHFSDSLFQKDRIPYTPVNEALAEVIACGESRDFLLRIGIAGEIISVPSHSPDSVAVMLDDGVCIAGDLESPEYADAYEGEKRKRLNDDWKKLLSFSPEQIFFSHKPERIMR